MGSEAGGGDACLEMRKVRRVCIVDDGSRVLGVSIPELCYRSSGSRNRKRRGKKRGLRALTLPSHVPPISSRASSPIRRSTQGTARMRHPTQTTQATPRNYNRMRPPMSMVNTKSNCPISGGGAELEEGGRDLKRERDAGEGVCHVGWAWAGWNNNGGGFVVEEGGS